VRIAPELAWQMVDGEGVIVDLPRRRVLGLNPVGSLIWTLIGQASEAEIAAAVALRFEVDEPRARADVRAFLGALEERGFLSPS
jgi:hypothetical protein